MRLFLLITMFIMLSQTMIAQQEYEEIAFKNAQAMIQAYNENDHKQFADFLTPEQYPFKDKTNFYSVWKKILENDNSNITNLKINRFRIFETNQQAYFTMNFGERNSSFFGISKDSGESWHFTQFIGKLNFDQIKKSMIPQLDVSFSDQDPNYSKRISYEIGKSIAYSTFEKEDVNGIKLNIEQLEGKVIVLNFWSTGCAPCIKEIPQLNELVEKMKNKDIVFIAPAFHSSNSNLNSFLAKHPFSYRVISEEGDKHNVTVLPTHVIIDGNQKVIGKFIGGNNENLLKIESIINNLVKNIA